MIKKKIKIREIKKKIKVTEIKKETEESLDDIVEVDESSPISKSSRSISPSLEQNLDSIPNNSDRKLSFQSSSTKEEKEISTAVNYATSQTTSRRSYDSGIRASGDVSAQPRAMQERINPTLPSSSPLMEHVNQNAFDLNRADNSILSNSTSEPALRKFNKEERDYTIERSEVYESRRKKM